MTLLFLISSGSLSFADDIRKTKDEEEESSTISVDRAREMMEYESYLNEKQGELDKLRGMSNTQRMLMQLREGGQTPKGKTKNEDARLQEKFLKEKLKAPEESKEKIVKEKPTEEKDELKLEKQKIPKLPQEEKLKSLEEEENKRSNLYKMRLTADYRSTGEVRLKEKSKRGLLEADDAGEEALDRKKTEDILDNVPFLRLLNLSPYAFESQDFEEDYDFEE